MTKSQAVPAPDDLADRDPAFADADRYKERSRQDKRRRAGTNPHRFTPKDFDYDEKNRTCRCPAGHNLYRNGNHVGMHGYLGLKFQGAKSVCGRARSDAAVSSPRTLPKPNRARSLLGRPKQKKNPRSKR